MLLVFTAPRVFLVGISDPYGLGEFQEPGLQSKEFLPGHFETKIKLPSKEWSADRTKIATKKTVTS